MAKFVYLVLDDPPAEQGEWEILAAYDNPKAAATHEKAYRQEDEFRHQYVDVRRIAVRSQSILIPVKKRRTA